MGRVGGVFYRERRRVVVVVDAREVIKRMILTLGNPSKVMFPPSRRNHFLAPEHNKHIFSKSIAPIVALRIVLELEGTFAFALCNVRTCINSGELRSWRRRAQPRTEHLPFSAPPSRTASSLAGGRIQQPSGKSCLPPLKELPAQVGALDFNLPSNDW